MAGRRTVAQKFSFQSEIVLRFMSPGERRDVYTWCPKFALPLLSELAEQVRGMDFYVPAKSDGSSIIRMFERSTEEICQLVDWSCSIWNEIVAKDLRSRKLNVHEIVRDAVMRDGWSSRDSLRLMFEGWGEDDDGWGEDYVSLNIFPFPGGEDPFATPGNLCAAIGLAVLDYAILLRDTSTADDVIDAFGAAWNFALVARSLNRQDMGHQFDLKSRSARMSRAAATRYSRDPKQAIKAEVKECWKRWQENQTDYERPTQFARAMIDKWPDDLQSEAVIVRWVRAWNREEAEK